MLCDSPKKGKLSVPVYFLPPFTPHLPPLDFDFPVHLVLSEVFPQFFCQVFDFRFLNQRWPSPHDATPRFEYFVPASLPVRPSLHGSPIIKSQRRTIFPKIMGEFRRWNKKRGNLLGNIICTTAAICAILTMRTNLIWQ